MSRRTFKGRENRKIGSHSEDDVRTAIQLFLNGYSIRKAAKEVNLPYPTLRRYVHKYKNNPNCRLTPNYEVNMVFSKEQEGILKSYLVDCASKFYGVSSKECRRIAYQMAKINNIKMPTSWEASKMAGKEWLHSFKKRNPEITIKKPEPCSLARVTSFNRSNVQNFFSNLKDVMQRHPTFGDGSRIYNLDETSTTTVQRPQKVIALKGRNVCKVTSGERGILVTTCLIINALGQALPPAMVFPRKNFQPHMLHGAPTGTLGLATPSGWMNTEIFLDVMKHFVKHTSASKDNPALLIMDNHESHLSLEALDLAKASGVTVLTLHPHTTAKMQPLDVAINAPFKTYYNAAVDSWMLRHPGKSVTIYNVAECVGQAFLKALTPASIVNAFRKCGIYPFDDCIFNDEDFLPSQVTDRPLNSDEDTGDVICEGREAEDSCMDNETRGSPSIFDLDDLQTQEQCISIGQHTPKKSNCKKETNDCNNEDAVPMPAQFIDRTPNATASKVTSLVENQRPSSTNTTMKYRKDKNLSMKQDTSPYAPKKQKFISPQIFRPPLKAGARKNIRKRQLGKSIIATDTPVKEALAQKKAKGAKKVKQDLFTEAKKCKKSVQIICDSNSPGTTTDEEFVPSGSSSGGEKHISDEDEDDKILDEEFLPLTRDPCEGDYVIVQFQSKKQHTYYVAKVLEELEDEEFDYYVSYLKLKSKMYQRFSDPIIPDLAGVNRADIKYILPSPKFHGTSRRQTTLKFAVNMSLINLGL